MYLFSTQISFPKECLSIRVHFFVPRFERDYRTMPRKVNYGVDYDEDYDDYEDYNYDSDVQENCK